MEWKVVGKDEIGPVIRVRPGGDGFVLQVRERTETGFVWSARGSIDRVGEWGVDDFTPRIIDPSYSGPFGVACCYDTDQVMDLIGGVDDYWQNHPYRNRPSVPCAIPDGWRLRSGARFGAWFHEASGSTIDLAYDGATWSETWGVESKGRGARLCRGGVSVQPNGYPHVIVVDDVPPPAETLETIPVAEWDQVMERIASFVECDGETWIATITNPDGSMDSIGGLVGDEVTILTQALEYFPIMDAATAKRNKIAKLVAELDRLNKELDRLRG